MSEQDIDRYALAPEVEAERLRSLAQLHVFRSPPEDRYAHITHMACTVLGVPLSAILFIDEDSQWCKQFSGDIEPDFDVPRSDSACRATSQSKLSRTRQQSSSKLPLALWPSTLWSTSSSVQSGDPPRRVHMSRKSLIDHCPPSSSGSSNTPSL